MFGKTNEQVVFAEIVRSALERAAREQWKSMVWCDYNFHEWPLGERATIEMLNAWAGAGRSLVIIAQDYQPIIRHHARFVQWRKTWSHIIDCRARRGVNEEDFPSALWSPQWAMQQSQQREMGRNRWVVDLEPSPRMQLKETLDEHYRQSTPAFPATTLGL